MEIRHAKEQELDRIMEIYAYAREFMKVHGNPNQWGPTNWPPRELIEKDIAMNRCYVCVDQEKIVGVFFYDCGEKIEPGYNYIEGAWKGSEDYGVVHRVASDGSVRGVGSFCISWAYEQCGHLRIDTHGDNVVMQGMLEKNGFERCGTIYVEEDDYPRIAYEKM